MIRTLGEKGALCVGLVVTVLTYAAEGTLGGNSWMVYAAVLMPIKALTSYVTSIGLKSLLTQAASGSSDSHLDLNHAPYNLYGTLLT